MLGSEAAPPIRLLVYAVAYAHVAEVADQARVQTVDAWWADWVERPDLDELRWERSHSPSEGEFEVQVPVWMLLPVSGASNVLANRTESIPARMVLLVWRSRPQTGRNHLRP